MKSLLKAFLCLISPLSVSLAAISQDNEKTFDSLLSAHFHADGPGAVVLLARDKQLLYRKAFGKANLELDVDMQPDHVFRIGSITKQFTACAILHLAEQGKLSLSDDIHRFIPGYPQQDKKITIEHLLTHTSGIKNYTGLPQFTPALKRRDLSPGELVDLFKDEPLDFEPGSRFRYSNSGYVLLGYIIEQITGKSYAAYIDETIFRPLGMNNSFYDNASLLIPHRAAGYKPVKGGYANADFLSMTLPYAAGGLATNAGDLFTWYKALMDGQLISRESLSKAHASHQLDNGQPTGYGLGWFIGNVQGSPGIKHNGVVNGFLTYAAYLPEEKLYVSIFANYENAPDPDILGSEMLAILLGKPYHFQKITMTRPELTSYQGVYTMEDGVKKIISLQDGELMYFSPGGLKARLIPTQKDHFFMENSINSFTFKRDENGRVTGFTLASTGLPQQGARSTGEIAALDRIAVPLALLSRYAGKYRFNQGPVFEVKLEGGSLYGQVGDDKKELVPFGQHAFFARELDAAIIFNLDANDHVSGLTKLQNGEMKAQRISP